ncbi:MAG: rRNA maturation RNase YbeY [Candidatus Pacebacteria bacterium]|nr:rRNA maturation RNase YbeY [Candidatus Paceibacterota bacterium]
MSISITNLTRGNIPYKGLPLSRIAEKVLGKKYELSLVFVGDTRSRTLNKLYRGKDKPTNILSFELDENQGEIFINPRIAKKQAPKFGRTYKNFLCFLFIHGAHHLKGMEHGSTMDKAEEKIQKLFKI